ncbi:MAG: hypothetical protein M1837_006930 [Sclerophora amabilis]|nr:MAG: hypothetical protein M1837_006930 [Sclerophora amabilis]
MAADDSTQGKNFINLPSPKFGPDRQYANTTKSNPVVRGIALSFGASVISSVTLVQNYLWANAGFDSLRSIRELDSVEPRYEPNVIPVEKNSEILEDHQLHPEFPSPPAEDLKNTYYSATHYHALFRSGKLTPIALVEALLPHIRRDIPSPSEHSKAFLDSKIEIIRNNAESSTKRYKEGQSLGVLDGVPVAVKDEVDLEGYKRNLGSKRDFTGKEDATSWCVKKWEEAGAIIVGKLSMHELGLDTTNNNPNHGTPLNPFNDLYYTGGSSGGSAYAVSTGVIPIALGADGGGSIRIPANYCGVYGLKPTHGRVSGMPVISLATSTGVIGPIAGTMEDLEISYRVMASPIPGSMGWSHPPPSSSSATSNRVIGLYGDWFDRADPDVKKVCQTALKYYEHDLKYTMTPITIPFVPEGQTAHALTILSEISTSIGGDVTGLTAPNKVLISVGTKTPAGDFLLAQKLRNLLMQHLAALFRKHPGLIIVTPTTPNAGWHISGGPGDLKYGVSDANMSMRSMEYVWLANFTGLPSISVPVGYVDPVKGEGKIPVGLMAMAEWGSEDQLIQWGKESETWFNGLSGADGRKRPGKWLDVVKLAMEHNGSGEVPNPRED